LAEHLHDVIPRPGESEERTRIRLFERDIALHDIATWQAALAQARAELEQACALEQSCAEIECQ